MGDPETPVERRTRLQALGEEARGCRRCPRLYEHRTTVVFGAGVSDADLMLVGEAPGQNEDRQGLPLIGAAGRLLDELLGEIGIAREEVFVTSALKCRPPDNRDALAQELDNCRGYLVGQLELIRPRVVCPLGNVATRLLRGDPAGIRAVHGRDEIRTIGKRAVRLMPLFHPAAALYESEGVAQLRADVARLPSLLALPRPEQPPAPAPAPDAERPGVAQLGLF